MTRQQRYQQVLDYFSQAMPDAATELLYSNPYELLVAVMLSAQCTDKRVNQVTPSLFKAFPSVRDLAQTSPQEVLHYVASVSYPNSKSQHLVAMARKVVADFEGNIPSSRDELETLPGVGRKTANVICTVLYNMPVMPVDTHVFRVANRIGLTVNSKNPLETERILEKNIPSDLICRAHHWLILHGRYVCTARNPKCDSCGICDYCREYAALSKNK